MGERPCHTSFVTIAVEPMLIGVVTVESLVRSDPHIIAALQDICDIKSIERSQQRRYFLPFQSTALICQTIESLIQPNPRFSVAFHITDADVWGIDRILIVINMTHLSVVRKCQLINIPACDKPNMPKSITIGFYARLQ